MVRVEITHDVLALAVAVAAVWWLLTRPPTPPERLAARQPVPRGEARESTPEPGGEKVTELRPTSRAASA